MRVLPAVLLLGLLTSSVAWAGPRVPLVEVSARDDDDAADADAVPDGCMFRYLCYAPPSGEDAAPWVQDSKWTYLLLRDVTVVGLSILPLVNLTFPVVWVPFAFHLTIPEDVRPSLSGDLLLGLVLFGVGQVGLAVLALPLLILPGGIIAYVALYWTMALWIAPVTMLHLYNKAMKENGDGETRPKRERKPRKKPKRRAVIEDDDE